MDDAIVKYTCEGSQEPTTLFCTRAEVNRQIDRILSSLASRGATRISIDIEFKDVEQGGK